MHNYFFILCASMRWSLVSFIIIHLEPCPEGKKRCLFHAIVFSAHLLMPNTFPSFFLLPDKSKTKTNIHHYLVVSLATSLKRAHSHSILFITGKKRGGGGPSRITLGRKSPLRLSWTLPVRSVAVKVRWSLCHFSLSLLGGRPCLG